MLSNLFLTLILSNIFLFLLLHFNFKKISNKFNIFDIPSKRKIHTKKTSLVGGLTVIVFFFFNLIFLSAFLGNDDFYNYLNFKNQKFYFFFIFLLVIFFLIGLYDDKYNVLNSKKLLWITFFCFLTVFPQDSLQVVNLNFSFNKNFSVHKFSILFITICFVSLMVIMNLYDGTNLQSGLFYFINYSLIFLISDNIFVIFIFLVPILIFMIFNFAGKCFLGDSGSNFFSCVFGVMLISFYNNEEIIYADHILLMVFIPLVDAIRLFFKRILNNGIPFKADKDHLHHRLLLKTNYNRVIILLSIFPILTSIIIFFNLNILLGSLILLILYFFYLKK